MGQEVALWEGPFLRRLVAWAARSAPIWFVRSAPVVIGFFFALTLPTARRAVQRNLRLIDGRRSGLGLWRDTFSTFANFAACLTESMAPGRAAFRAREFQVEGSELVEPLRRAGTGMLFLTAHVGPWDTSAMGLDTFTDAEVMMLMAPERDHEAAEVQDLVRGNAKIRVVRVGDSVLDAAPALEHLRGGGIVVGQMDRVRPQQATMPVTIFGESWRIPRGLFRLAGAARVPVVPVFSARQGFARRLVSVTMPIVVPRRPSEEALSACAQVAVRSLEAHLRRFPTQWFHFEPSTSTSKE